MYEKLEEEKEQVRALAIEKTMAAMKLDDSAADAVIDDGGEDMD